MESSSKNPRQAARSGAEALRDAVRQAGRGEAEGTLEEPVTEETAEVVDSELDQVTRQRDEFRGDLQRITADFENFRKRALREREQASANADAKLLGELLVVLDDMERALDHAPEDEAGDGVRLVHSRLLGVLTSHGLSEVATNVPFDPHLHEALMMQPVEGKEHGTILEVVQKGWSIGDRVLRHARVIVAE